LVKGSMVPWGERWLVAARPIQVEPRIIENQKV
jgi:hypothetical protein